ncbi:MAG: hypothetical protein ACON5A_03740 [Candidatus Comchoanobacterales bacterium]
MKNKLSLTVALAVGFLSAPAIYAKDHESTDEGHHIRKPTVDIINVGHEIGGSEFAGHENVVDECNCVEPDMVRVGQYLDPSEMMMMMMQNGVSDPGVIHSILNTGADPRILSIPVDHHGPAETSSDPAMWGETIIDITFDGNRLLLEKLPEGIAHPMQFHLDDQGFEITSDGYRLLLETLPEAQMIVVPMPFHPDDQVLPPVPIEQVLPPLPTELDLPPVPTEQRKDIKH